MKKHASPEGVQALQSKMDAIKSAYNKTAEDAAERQNTVGCALRHRQNFYGQLQDFEKWLKKSQRKLDTGNEIYADEVPELMARLKVSIITHFMSLGLLLTLGGAVSC